MKNVLLSLVASLSLGVVNSGACAKISSMDDFTGDGEVNVVFVGDSLVVGFGDAPGKGGYVARAQKKFPSANFNNLGELGLKSQQLLLKLERAFDAGASEEVKLRNALLKADYVVLDLGRNDRWDFGLPSATSRNLKRAAKLIKSRVTAEGKVAPLVVTAVMMLPNRGSQGPWVKELNELIFKSNSTANPADLRFDLVSKRLLSSDQIHPTSKGYDALAQALTSYIKKTLVTKHISKLRTDKDNDNVFDELEKLVFGTDPANADTDGDGHTDGAEICNLGTDPLTTETPPTP